MITQKMSDQTWSDDYVKDVRLIRGGLTITQKISDQTWSDDYAKDV